MSCYSIALFVHIVGTIVLFALLAIEGVTLRTGTSAARLNRILGPISALAILVPGVYMAASQAGWTGWVVVGLVTWVFIAVLGAFTGISVMRGRMSRGTATISWLIRVGIALAVVFDMTVKPDVTGAVIAVVVGLVVAAGAAVPTVRMVRPA